MFSISKCKKYVTFGCIVLLLSMTLPLLISCEQDLNNMDYPDEKLLTRISEDYKKHLIETGMIDKNSTAQCEIIRCYGIYSGSVALIIECSELFYPATISNAATISGFIMFDDPYRINIWNNGDFYSLSDAYENDILSEHDMREIVKKHNCYGREWIATKYTDYVCDNNTDVEAHEYALDYYYGHYVNYIDNTDEFHTADVVMFNDSLSNKPHVGTVAGVEFIYQDGNSIKVMIDNGTDFLSLQDAYDQGFISSKDIELIAYIHNSQRYFNDVQS